MLLVNLIIIIIRKKRKIFLTFRRHTGLGQGGLWAPRQHAIEASKHVGVPASTPPSGVTPCGSQKLASRPPASPGSPRSKGGKEGGTGDGPARGRARLGPPPPMRNPLGLLERPAAEATGPRLDPPRSAAANRGVSGVRWLWPRPLPLQAARPTPRPQRRPADSGRRPVRRPPAAPSAAGMVWGDVCRPRGGMLFRGRAVRAPRRSPPGAKTKKDGGDEDISSVPVEIRFGVSDIDRDVTARDFFRAVSLIRACGPGIILLSPVRSADTPPSPSSKEEEKGSGGCVGASMRGGVRVETFGPRRPSQSSPPVGRKTRCWERPVWLR